MQDLEILPMSVLLIPWNDTNGGHPKFSTIDRFNLSTQHETDNKKMRIDTPCPLGVYDKYGDVILEENPYYMCFTGLDQKGSRSIANQEEIRKYEFGLQQKARRLEEERRQIPTDCIPEGASAQERISILSQVLHEMSLATKKLN